MEKYKVYLLTFPNGKKYCGFTSNTLQKRWSKKRCPLVYRAILKYGWDNISKECVFSSSNRQETLEKEKEIIALFELTDPDKGYNLHATGSDFFLTEEGRQRIIEGLRNRKPSEALRVANLGRTVSEETRRKISESKKGQAPPNQISVSQIEKGTGRLINHYRSATDAAREIGHPGGESNILKVCKGQRRTAYGYEWRFVDKND